MAVRIRLRRIGKRKQPQYRLVAAEAAGPRDGRFIEILGHYDPRREPRAVSVNEERALWWLRNGAQPSDTARSILTETGVWGKFVGDVGVGEEETGGEPAEKDVGLEESVPREESEEGVEAEEASVEEAVTEGSEAADEAT